MHNVFGGSGRISFRCFRFLRNTLMGLGSLCTIAYASTPANTLIENTAVVNYVILGQPGTTSSNTSGFFVDELISYTLVTDNPSGVGVQSPETNSVLAFKLTNEGNGSETFNLGTSQTISPADDFDSNSVKIYLDSNNNQIFELGTDTLYTPTVNDPALAMGAAIHLFLVSDIPGALSQGDEAKLSLSVTSSTGAGPMGTIYPTQGDGGVDALMGTQGGTVSVESKYFVPDAAATLTKSVVVVDPNGGTNAVPDAVLTYTLTLNTTGAGPLSGIVVSDVIPAGTTYVAQSMQLNNTPLTDAALDDAGVFYNGTEVRVSIPTVTVPTTHIVSFKVRIQ